MTLRKGENTIRLYSESGWMADIDRMTITKKGLAEGEKDEIVTSVNFVLEEHIDNTIYTLQGQRLNVPLNALPKGVYIVGGKKITN